MTLRLWQVQASLQGVTPDGWQSSRQLPTMIIGADDVDHAARAVSDLAWDMTPRDYVQSGTRRTVATVCQVDESGQVTTDAQWIYISYGWGGISAAVLNTYAELVAHRAATDGEGD